MSISSTWSILRWKKTNQIEGWFEVNLDLSSLVGAAVFNQIYSQWIIYDWKFLGIYLLFTFSLRALVAHKFYLHYVSGRFWFMLRTHFKCLRRLFFVFGNLLFFCCCLFLFYLHGNRGNMYCAQISLYTKWLCSFFIVWRIACRMLCRRDSDLAKVWEENTYIRNKDV